MKPRGYSLGIAVFGAMLVVTSFALAGQLHDAAEGGVGEERVHAALLCELERLEDLPLVRVVDAAVGELLDRLMKDADALISVDKLGIGTTCYQIVGEKPAV